MVSSSSTIHLLNIPSPVLWGALHPLSPSSSCKTSPRERSFGVWQPRPCFHPQEALAKPGVTHSHNPRPLQRPACFHLQLRTEWLGKPGGAEH